LKVNELIDANGLLSTVPDGVPMLLKTTCTQHGAGQSSQVQPKPSQQHCW
jgi:hypothetical protein